MEATRTSRAEIVGVEMAEKRASDLQPFFPCGAFASSGFTQEVGNSGHLFTRPISFQVKGEMSGLGILPCDQHTVGLQPVFAEMENEFELISPGPVCKELPISLRFHLAPNFGGFWGKSAAWYDFLFFSFFFFC